MSFSGEDNRNESCASPLVNDNSRRSVSPIHATDYGRRAMPVVTSAVSSKKLRIIVGVVLCLILLVTGSFFIYPRNVSAEMSSWQSGIIAFSNSTRNNQTSWEMVLNAVELTVDVYNSNYLPVNVKSADLELAVAIFSDNKFEVLVNLNQTLSLDIKESCSPRGYCPNLSSTDSISTGYNISESLWTTLRAICRSGETNSLIFSISGKAVYNIFGISHKAMLSGLEHTSPCGSNPGYSGDFLQI